MRKFERRRPNNHYLQMQVNSITIQIQDVVGRRGPLVGQSSQCTWSGRVVFPLADRVYCSINSFDLITRANLIGRSWKNFKSHPGFPAIQYVCQPDLQARGLLFDSPAQCGELVFDSTVISMRYKSAGKQQIKRAVEESAHPKPPFVCNQRNREASRAVWVTLSNDGQLIARLAGTNASASVATTTDIAALWRDVKVQRGRDLGHGLGLNKGILIINQR